MFNPLLALEATLHSISNSLLYPVMILVFLLSVWIVFYAGSFLSEFISRIRLKNNIEINEYLKEISVSKKLPDDLCDYLPLRIISYAKKLSRLISENNEFLTEKIEYLIQEKELKLKKDVDKIKLLIRIAPSLGLMGTLIPMGAALSALGQGNMDQLTSSLTVAFTTTVVGLALGVVAVFFASFKENWMIEDIRNIELITEAMTKDIVNEIHQEKTCL